MTYKRKFGGGGGPQNIQRESLVCQFLIDTLPIRIASKSFPCIIGARSNRHSSETICVRCLSFNSFISFPSFTSFDTRFASAAPPISSVQYALISLANTRGLN